jgi:hypothetical protein
MNERNECVLKLERVEMVKLLVKGDNNILQIMKMSRWLSILDSKWRHKQAWRVPWAIFNFHLSTDVHFIADRLVGDSRTWCA